VVGATGKVGTPTVEQLIAAGAPKIRVLVRDVEKAKKTLGNSPSIEYIKGDFEDVDSVIKAFPGISRVFVIPPHADEVIEAKLAQAAKAAGIKLYLKLSVVMSATDPPGGILRPHRLAEESLAQSGVPFAILRPAFFMQNLLGDAGSIKGQSALYRVAGNYRLTYIDTRDIAASAVQILTASDKQLAEYLGNTYLLSGPAAYSKQEVTAMLSKVLGREIKGVEITDDQFYNTLKGYGLPIKLCFGLVKLYQALKQGVAEVVYQDFEILLNGRKQRTLEAFLNENKAAFL